MKADSGTDSHVNYSMQAWRASVEEQNNALFTMDSHGKVTVLSDIDLENEELPIKPQYKFKVTAMNKDSESSFCWLLININDINDNPPIFAKSEYKFSVSEAVQRNTIVGWVEVTDLDEVDRNRLDLRLVFPQNHPHPPLFSVDKNGRIQTTASLDREKIELFKFDVLAKDSISPIHTAKVKKLSIIKVRDI
jgi:hypothetical protein